MTENERNKEYIQQMYTQVLRISKIEDLAHFLKTQLDGNEEVIGNIKDLLEQEIEKVSQDEALEEEFKEELIKEIKAKIKEIDSFFESLQKKEEDEFEIISPRPIRIVWARKPSGESYCYDELKDCENEIKRENYYLFWDLLKKFIDVRDYQLTGDDKLTSHEKIRDLFKIKPTSRGRQERFYCYQIGDVIFIIGAYSKKGNVTTKWQDWLIGRKKDVSEQYEELKQRLKDPQERERILKEEEEEFKRIEELIKPRTKIERKRITTEEGIKQLKKYYEKYGDLEVPIDYKTQDEDGKLIELGKWLSRASRRFSDVEIKRILEIIPDSEKAISWIDPLKIEELNGKTMEEIIEGKRRKKDNEETETPQIEKEPRFKEDENGEILYKIDLNGERLDRERWTNNTIAALHEFYKREQTYDIPENLIVIINSYGRYEIGKYIHGLIREYKITEGRKRKLMEATDAGFISFIEKKHAEFIEERGKEEQSSEVPSIEIIEPLVDEPTPAEPQQEIVEDKGRVKEIILRKLIRQNLKEMNPDELRYVLEKIEEMGKRLITPQIDMAKVEKIVEKTPDKIESLTVYLLIYEQIKIMDSQELTYLLSIIEQMKIVKERIKKQ
ncbi:MAG: helicase associated domain-containing protein [Bacilli bacterium]|nr:helicase associated domain-containing protein [Bacilli bacterium]